MELRKAIAQDIQAIADLISRENHPTETAYIKHWFFDKPIGNSAISVVEENGQLEGIATTNNFVLNDHGDKLVAMPQKVLTSKALRGKGFFGKMYRHTEEMNLIENKVDYFLTITNEASTDIFLKKFAYRRGMSPDVHILFNSPIDAFVSKYQLKDSMDGLAYKGEMNQSFKKDTAYMNWRYSDNSDYRYIVLSSGSFAVLKKMKKGGVPFFMLLDMSWYSMEDTSKLLKASQNYSLKNGAFGLMLLKNEVTEKYINSKILKYSSKGHFNFLVKGKDEQESSLLSQKNYNFFFGDFDFV